MDQISSHEAQFLYEKMGKQITEISGLPYRNWIYDSRSFLAQEKLTFFMEEDL